MTDKPNPADFSVAERPREYEVRIAIEGEMILTVQADDLDDAKSQAEKLAERIAEGDEDADLDEIFDVRVDHVRKTKPLFRVTRDGKATQVSHLVAGDLPRAPSEYGF
jgi:hypothetical protein